MAAESRTLSIGRLVMAINYAKRGRVSIIQAMLKPESVLQPVIRGLMRAHSSGNNFVFKYRNSARNFCCRKLLMEYKFECYD